MMLALGILLIAVLASAQDYCENHAPITHPSQYSEAFFGTNICTGRRFVSEYCNDGVMSLYHLELKDSEGKASCVHLTSAN